MTDTTTIAKNALQDLERAVILLLKDHPGGLRNVEVSKLLGLESSFEGGQKNYLFLSLLGRLIADGRVVSERNPVNGVRRYKVPQG